ncbi:MAG: PadR family transcriptional regulator [Actinomycetia bacterium]|jgi:DNA-binding PadR family transcriptional regulator|nr:PadR family transcriptional regulator [Actinomycetes bacterium]
MSERGRSNPLALAVLSCLHEKPMHPYEVAQTLRTREKHESIKLNYGSLYSVIGSLEKRELIAARETVREGRRPERTIYEITATGERELVDWLSVLVAQPIKEYLRFEAALSLLGALPPEDAVGLLKERVGRLEMELVAMRATRAQAEQLGLPRLFMVEGEYVEALHETELAFVQGLIKDIEGGSLEGMDLWRALYAPQRGDEG